MLNSFHYTFACGILRNEFPVILKVEDVPRLTAATFKPPTANGGPQEKPLSAAVHLILMEIPAWPTTAPVTKKR